ncbi:GAP1-N2 domain-containing protein [Neobacillus cucumis]|uniref:GAP1-N2 domain-containing protein n=1 Tax=Neobacillus cucumis TaxID=1740721 RepID=UPI0019637532|nr:hypothetical protein [Neobacillus cucumis]MBM7654765.1 hypothetical protein [Neobacillus cucumis]
MTGKIQQHMYTRERKGIFHDTAGYDSIAMSEGLKPAFVKKYLHPFCFYHVPRTLREKAERDPTQYPTAVTILQPETGELVVGQAVFVPADFTGSRSTYFLHHYVIPPSLKEEWIQNPEMLFRVEAFQTAYEVEQGQLLPELEVVPFNDSLMVDDELLAVLGISMTAFRQLLLAVMLSISGKKKVYISLPVPLQDYTEYALRLMEFVYRFLPFAHRRRLGLLTFTSEPEARNDIHVTFFEPGSLNIHDRSIAKQFLFDFARGKISGVEIGQSAYLRFAAEHLSESPKMEKFFEFTEMALAGFTEGQLLALGSYDQLITLYRAFSYDDFTDYFKNKLGFIKNLFYFLQIKGEEKLDLLALFLKVWEVEKKGEEPS